MPPPPLIGRGSLGVPAPIVVNEVTASGFEMLHLHRDWPGRGPLGSYCAVFLKPTTEALVPLPESALLAKLSPAPISLLPR
jgi:hypothetical protein